MKFKATVVGMNGIGVRFKALEQAGRDTMLAQLERSAIAIHKEAIKGVQKVSHGGKQWRYGPKRLVTVSRPGDAFNSDTGKGIGSIKFEVDKSAMTAVVGSNVKYLAALEVGTSNMAARPWLSLAVQKTKASLLKGIVFVSKALK